jgi:hypothetical protein
MPTTVEQDFVPLAVIAEQTGAVTYNASRRLRRLGVVLFRDPSDHRRRLVRQDDAERAVEALSTPRPVTPAAAKEGRP